MPKRRWANIRRFLAAKPMNSQSLFGIPVHYKKLRNSDWRKVEERFEKRLTSCKGKHLSMEAA
jgi:hypothetical protein